MKLLLLCIALTFTTVNSFAQVNQYGPFAIESIEDKFEANQNPVKGIILVIGRKSKQCSGFGICRFEIVISWDEIFQLFKAQQTANGKLAVRFGTETYNHNRSKLPNDYFVIEEDFKLDQDAAQDLGFKKGYTIKKGKYKVTYDNKTKSYNVMF